jgi:3-hydroxyacyl-[acyl-carrier-protein] dehydratase
MNRETIKQVIGVGEPYLWLDEVIQINDNRIHARKFLDPNLDIFKSHYVDFPLFPGSLQCEATFQASAVLIAQTHPVTAGHIPVIARVRNTKFRKMARPGDTLDIIVEIEDQVGSAFTLKGHVSVAGATTTELIFIATEAPAPTIIAS